MIKPGRHRIFARLFWALAVLGLILSACNYQTIGQLSGTAAPTKASAGAKTVPTKTKAGAKAAAPRAAATATENNPILCRLSDLTPAATWNVTDQGLSGSLTLTNYWPVTCTLRGEPQLGLTDDKGQDFYLQVSGPTPAPLPSWKFKENTVGEVRFTWSNWCGPEPAGHMRVTVALAGQVEPALYVPVEDQNGNLLNNAPPCVDKSKPSTLMVEGINILN